VEGRKGRREAGREIEGVRGMERGGRGGEREREGGIEVCRERRERRGKEG
jgi:hypothetical protein